MIIFFKPLHDPRHYKASVNSNSGLGQKRSSNTFNLIREISHIHIYPDTDNNISYGIIRVHVKLCKNTTDFALVNDNVVRPLDLGNWASLSSALSPSTRAVRENCSCI